MDDYRGMIKSMHNCHKIDRSICAVFESPNIQDIIKDPYAGIPYSIKPYQMASLVIAQRGNTLHVLKDRYAIRDMPYTVEIV